MGSLSEELSHILFVCGDDCSATLVFKKQFSHLKSCIDLVLPIVSDLNGRDVEDSTTSSAITARAQDALESLHNIVCECTSNESVVKHLSNFADVSASITQSYYTLLEFGIAFSMKIPIDAMVSRWQIFQMQLVDWRDAIQLMDTISETLRSDPRHSKTDLAQVQDVKKRLIYQYPEPDSFSRVRHSDIYPFHPFNESKADEEEDSNICPAAGETVFSILGTGSAGIPVACKNISATKLKKGSKSLKEIADLYLLTDSTSSPCVNTMLKVSFVGEESVSMIFALPHIGNLNSMLAVFGKARKKTVGEPGSHEAWLAEHRRVEGKLSVMSDVLSGLMYLHSKGIVHGRLKPSNVLVLDSYRARITDYGISPHLKVSAAVETWLKNARSAREGSRPPPESSTVPYNELPIGEGGIRWLAPELLLIPPAEGDSKSVYGDLLNPHYTSDKYAASMLLYYIIFEKFPFYNIVWSEGIYNLLLSGDRPSLDTTTLDCPEEELFAPVHKAIENGWKSDPASRGRLVDMADVVTRIYQEVSFDIESRLLNQLTEKLELNKDKPEALKETIAKNDIKIAKGEQAIERKKAELENALNGKQRKEFTAQLEKGRVRLDTFIAETNAYKKQLAEMEAGLKATKKAIKSQTEKRYGGSEHILRHRVSHKDATFIEDLIKRYKGKSSKADIDDSMRTAGGEGVACVSAGGKHALQSFLFNCGYRTKSFADEMAEYRQNCECESDIIDDELMELCIFACGLFEENSVSEKEIPRFLKTIGSISISGMGSVNDPRRGSATLGFHTPLGAVKIDSDTRSEISEKSDVSKGLPGMALVSSIMTSSIRSGRGKHEGASSPTHTDNSEDELFKFEIFSVNSDAKSGASGEKTEKLPGVFKIVPLKDPGAQYLAAYRGRCEEALGLIKAGRGMDASVVSNLIESGETPAHVAASLGHLEVLRNLLENQVDNGSTKIFCTDECANLSEAVVTNSGHSLLHAACMGGCERTVRYLIETYDHFSPEDTGF